MQQKKYEIVIAILKMQNGKYKLGNAVYEDEVKRKANVIPLVLLSTHFGEGYVSPI